MARKASNNTNTALLQAGKIRKTRGPKAGSAQTNQNVKGVKTTAPKNADQIKTVVSPRTGGGVVVTDNAGNSCVVAAWQDVPSTRKIAVVGGSLKAVRAHIATIQKPKAQLARGVESRQAPQSAAAVRSQGKAAPEAKPAKGKAVKAAAPRTEKAAKNKQPSRGTNRTYKLGTRKDESKPDTFRRYMLTTIMSHKDTDSAKAAHAKSGKYPTHKLDFNWAAQQGYIVIAK